jgi:hypothetical protein
MWYLRPDDSPLKLNRWFWVLLVAACRPAATGVVSPSDGPCLVPGTSAPSFGTVSVAFSELENPGDRLSRRLTGATLIRVDCEGVVRAGLAHRWSRDAGGTLWTFELDSSSGSPPASALIEEWEARRNGGIWPWGRILEAYAVGRSRLEIRLDTTFTQVPAALALPALAFTTLPRVPGPAVRLLIHAPESDERDLLDASGGTGRTAAHLLITRSPAVISYASSRPELTRVSLPWDRTYVIVAPVRRPDLGPAGETGLRESLARDVVRSEARPAAGPFWWESAPCSGTTPLLPMGRQPQVVYLRGDQIGQEVAERLVAIQRTPLRAVAASAQDFAASLAGGESVMYILPLSRTVPAGCTGQPAWPSASSVIPLVDSRAQVILRPGVPSITVESDGTVRLAP